MAVVGTLLALPPETWPFSWQPCPKFVGSRDLSDWSTTCIGAALLSPDGKLASDEDHNVGPDKKIVIFLGGGLFLARGGHGMEWHDRNLGIMATCK